MKTAKPFERKWVLQGSLIIWHQPKQRSIFRKSLKTTIHLPDLTIPISWSPRTSPTFFAAFFCGTFRSIGFCGLTNRHFFKCSVPTHQAPLCSGVKELMCLSRCCKQLWIRVCCKGNPTSFQQPRTSKLGTSGGFLGCDEKPTPGKPNTLQDVFWFDSSEPTPVFSDAMLVASLFGFAPLKSRHQMGINGIYFKHDLWDVFVEFSFPKIPTNGSMKP